MFQLDIPAPVSDMEGTDKAWEKKRLKKACEAFEAVLTRQMIKEMKSSVIRAEEPSHAREMYESMMDEALADEMSRNGGMGIADILYRELLPLVEAEAPGKETESEAGKRLDDESIDVAESGATGPENK
jgi:Rod binding domain-containing protein